jgi:hypothetical protein
VIISRFSSGVKTPLISLTLTKGMIALPFCCVGGRGHWFWGSSAGLT